jgi:hypothetical protein
VRVPKPARLPLRIYSSFYVFLSKEKKQNSIQKIGTDGQISIFTSSRVISQQGYRIQIDGQQCTDQHGKEHERVNDHEIGDGQDFSSVSAFHFCLLGLAHANG